MSILFVIALVVLIVLYGRRVRRLWRRYRSVGYRARGQLGSERCFSPTAKRIIFRRDGGRCRHCGVTDVQVFALTGRHLQFDHRIPWSWGGPSTVENGQLLCQRCNLRKGARYVG